MGRERHRIDKLQFAQGPSRRMAHRTFITTSVRSSDRGALLENQSTSPRILSANSAAVRAWCFSINSRSRVRSEEHTSELQSRLHLVCRLLLEKKKTNNTTVQLDMTLHTTTSRGRLIRPSRS